MADQNITALPVSDTPVSSDQLLLVGATEEKLIDYDKLADAILNKLTSKNFSLDQGTMPLIRALNELNSKQTLGEISPFYGNIDKINGTSIRIATSQSSGTLPTKLEGNRYIIITDTHFDESRLIYAVQFAIGFGSSAIAIRNCNFTSVGSGKYSEWRYI